jgi:hypothetical protein
MQRIVCPGCGESFNYDRMLGGSLIRDYSNDPPGRVTFMVGASVAHRCADGEYLPPEQIATPRK